MGKIKDSIIIAKHKLFSPKIVNRHIKVEASAECNARCDWCWMIKAERKPRGLMQLSDFRHFVDLNRLYFRSQKAGIMPFFNGESLLHPQFFEFLDYIVINKVRLMDLDTNLGIYIDMARLMNYPFEFIRVNIGGITKETHEQTMKTNFNLVSENLKALFQINPKKVIVKMQVNRKNFHQIKQVPDFIKGLGGLTKNIIINPISFPMPMVASDKEIKDFFDENVSEEVADYLRFSYNSASPKYGIRAKEPGCHYITNCVTFDGKLTVCCKDQLGLFDLGNAFKNPLIKLFSSDKYKKTMLKARNMELNICKECN